MSILLVLLNFVVFSQPDESKDPYANMRWDNPSIDIVMGQDDGKWIVTHSLIPEVKVGDQIVSMNRKSVTAGDDINVILRQAAFDGLKGKWVNKGGQWAQSSEWSEPAPTHLKFRRTEIVNGRKKVDLYDFALKPRDLFELVLSQFNANHDQLNEWTTYSPKRDGIVGPTAITPTLTAIKGGGVVVSICVTYINDDWLFGRSLTVKSGNVRIELEPTKVTRDVLPNVRVSERLIFVERKDFAEADGTVTAGNLPRRVLGLLRASSSSDTFIRVNGQDTYVDHKLSEQDSIVFRNTGLLLKFLEQMANNGSSVSE